MKIVEFDSSEPLSEKALAEAMKYVALEPHEGWADLVVHTSAVLRAVRLATSHNLKKPPIKVRTECQTRIGRNDWTLKTRSVEVRVIQETVAE